jgi:CHAT domain-containing protein
MVRIADIRVGLLAYFVGLNDIFAVLADQDGRTKKFHLISCDRVLPFVDQLFGAVEGPCSPQQRVAIFEDFSSGWGRQLLPSMDSLQPFDVLVIVPHFVLHGLPFHAIRLDDDGHFLGTHCGVTYSPSGTLFARCVDRNPARSVNLSKWQFGLNGEDSAFAPPSPRRCRASGIDVKFQNTAEYHRLAEIFTQTFAEGDLTTPERISIKPFPNVEIETQVMCVVCHGHYDSAVPERSGLLLASNPSYRGERQIRLHHGLHYSFRDLPFSYVPPEIVTRPDRFPEILTVSELKVECQSKAELIALIGCSTASGRIGSADEFRSLAVQWLNVGAASVLASLWPLDFDVAQRWIPGFLKNWVVRRQPKAIAWREALREEIGLQRTPVSDWAVFALLGDWL